MIPWWLFAVVVLWAVSVTIFLFYRNPLPFPDWGHRCFAVPNENAAKVVTLLLEKLGGLKERFTFDPGPTHQTLLSDNTTVIIHHDAIVVENDLQANAISVVVSNPKQSAEEAKGILERAGFTAVIIKNLMPKIGDKFVLLSSNAFVGWSLGFRRHVLVMGQPPNKRELLGR